MCCCSAASVTIVDGLKVADPKEKCPLCRRVCPFPEFSLFILVIFFPVVYKIQVYLIIMKHFYAHYVMNLDIK